MPSNSGNRFLSNPPRRAHLSQARLGLFLAHDQRMGDRTIRLDDVSWICDFGRELRSPIRDAQVSSQRHHGPRRVGHTPAMCDWRLRSGHLHDRSNANPSSTVSKRYAACNIRNQPVRAASVRGAFYQLRSPSQKRDLGGIAPGTTLDGRLASVWLHLLRDIQCDICISDGSAGLRSRSQYRLAAAFRILYIHVVGGDAGVARNQVQSPGPDSGRFKSQNPIRPQKLGCERVVSNWELIRTHTLLLPRVEITIGS